MNNSENKKSKDNEKKLLTLLKKLKDAEHTGEKK